MPIYEYICADCENEFEELVFSRDETPPCPKCGSKNVTKLMSAGVVKTEGSIPTSAPCRPWAEAAAAAAVAEAYSFPPRSGRLRTVSFQLKTC